MEKFKYTADEYRRAVWEYILDHCDITKGGEFFVKFHTRDAATFHNHVLARINGYHRNDPVKKESAATVKKEEFKLTKEQKALKYKQEKKERAAKWKEIQKEIKRVAKINDRIKNPYWKLYYDTTYKISKYLKSVF